MSFFCKEKIFNFFLHFSGIMLKFAASLVLANANGTGDWYLFH